MDSFSQCIGCVDEAEHESKLEGRVGVQINVLQHQGAEQSHQDANSSAAKEYSEES